MASGIGKRFLQSQSFVGSKDGSVGSNSWKAQKVCERKAETRAADREGDGLRRP